MEDLEDTQNFHESALPDVVPLDAGKNLLMTKLTNLLRKESTIQITIHPLHCMFILQNIKSKILFLISSNKSSGKEKNYVL